MDKAWYSRNRERLLIQCKQYRQSHPEVYRKASLRQYHANKVVHRERNRRWYRKNKSRVNDKIKWRFRNDTVFAISMKLRARMISSLKRVGTYKNNKTVELLGADKQTVLDHIASQFKPGMSWDNHSEWHIDHRVPLASFDLTRESQQKLAFHYTNLQPLWKKENLQKHTKIGHEFDNTQPLLPV